MRLFERNRNKKRTTVRISWAILVSLSVIPASATLIKADERPNVVLIITDDQSPRNPPTPDYPHLVCPPGFGFGGDKVLTPNVDRLASEGMVRVNLIIQLPFGLIKKGLLTW